MSDYPSQGTPMDVEDHPAYNKPDATQQYAGDVIPMRPDISSANVSALQGQYLNQRSIERIAVGGSKSVDTTNLARTVLRPK